MKQYFSIGALLIDYRRDRDLSQMDLSSLINVDVRTIQRWEKDITLIKPDKEKEIAEATLLPYQLLCMGRKLCKSKLHCIYLKEFIFKITLSDTSDINGSFGLKVGSNYENMIDPYSYHINDINISDCQLN